MFKSATPKHVSELCNAATSLLYWKSLCLQNHFLCLSSLCGSENRFGNFPDVPLRNVLTTTGASWVTSKSPCPWAYTIALSYRRSILEELCWCMCIYLCTALFIVSNNVLKGLTGMNSHRSGFYKYFGSVTEFQLILSLEGQIWQCIIRGIFLSF